jgi:hypothetical protein
MSRPLLTLHAVGGLAMIAALAALAAVGCATKTVAPPPPDAPPPANSPANVVARFDWAMTHRDAGAIESMLTDDFLLVGASTDSAGNAAIQATDRAWFVAALDSMLNSSEQVSLVFDRFLLAFPDSRPGKSSTWHKQIRTSFNLKVRIDSGNSVEAAGSGVFFLTRGDSASIPPELVNRGVRPDSTTWWIDRFEDETLPGPAPPVPTKSLSFRQLLEYYFSRHPN